MVIRKSYLRRRAEGGPGSRVAEHDGAHRDRSLLGTIADLLHVRRRDRPPTELDSLEFPDLLTPQTGNSPDTERLINLLDLAFLGRASAGEIDSELNAMTAGTSVWDAEHFADDLFLAELVNLNLNIEVEGQKYRLHRRFLERVLQTPPNELDTLHFRQGILRELEAIVGADGRIRHLEIRGLEERRRNPFFRRPLRRWFDRMRIVYHRYSLRPAELVERLLMGVFSETVPALARVVQVVCHLEVYMAARTFADDARSRNLEVCLPEVGSVADAFSTRASGVPGFAR